MIPNENDIYMPILLKKIGVENEPIIVDVKPEINSMELDCFPIVQNKVNSSGGRMILGWQIWKSTNLIEAEFHAVWKSEENELIDITPKQISGFNHTLFVIDERLEYDEKQIDNIRINITSNKLVDEFILICESIFIFENKGERAYQYGNELKLNEVESKKYKMLKTLKNIYLQMIRNKASRNSPCLCGSGKKFKHCHGKNIKIQLLKLI